MDEQERMDGMEPRPPENGVDSHREPSEFYPPESRISDFQPPEDARAPTQDEPRPQDALEAPPPAPAWSPYAWNPDGPARPLKSENTGKWWHFLLSFFGTILMGFVLISNLEYYWTLVGGLLIVLGVVLRILLDKKNRWLAKGFLWGAVACIVIPLLMVLFLLGSCLLLLTGM